MDYYEGETLKEKIARGPFELAEAVGAISQVAEGLAEAPASDIVHRDIKPANIIVTEKGIVKILDFGLAKLAGTTKLTKTGMTVGTTAYMSPEQVRGDEMESRSDIWSLGVVLYELLNQSLLSVYTNQLHSGQSRVFQESENIPRSVSAGMPIFVGR